MYEQPNNAMVRFRNVVKSYDGVTDVVRSLNLDIMEGEFLTLLGPSGSGKTTCLMMLAGFESPTGGQIWLGDALINSVPPHKRNIGMVFQNYALFPHLTVEQNVGYALTVRRTPKAEKARLVNEALSMVYMSEFAHRRPAMLSGGQQQRVALARAVVFKPRLVLMDEPLGALDKRLREQMQVELKDLHKKLGITFVYVTHDQSEALTMSDRVAVFDSGTIEQIDDVKTLYESPRNAHVASFVGDNNIVLGKVTRQDNDVCEIVIRDGSRLRGVAHHRFRPGDSVRCCIRPERIFIVGEHSGLSGDIELYNSLRGTCIGGIYHGDHMRFRFAVEGGDCLVVKVSPDNPLLEQCKPDSRVTLNLSDRHIHVFPEA